MEILGEVFMVGVFYRSHFVLKSDHHCGKKIHNSSAKAITKTV